MPFLLHVRHGVKASCKACEHGNHVYCFDTTNQKQFDLKDNTTISVYKSSSTSLPPHFHMILVSWNHRPENGVGRTVLGISFISSLNAQFEKKSSF